MRSTEVKNPILAFTPARVSAARRETRWESAASSRSKQPVETVTSVSSGKVVAGVLLDEGEQQFVQALVLAHPRIGGCLQRVGAKGAPHTAAARVGVEGRRTAVVAEVAADGLVGIDPLDVSDHLPVEHQVLTAQPERRGRLVQGHDHLPRHGQLPHQTQIDPGPVALLVLGGDAEEVHRDQQSVLHRHAVLQGALFQVPKPVVAR
ncbi:hypothetical protein [Streptomyces phaeoluteigriseus]